MNKPFSSLFLALALASASSLALAEGPAQGSGGQPAPQAQPAPAPQGQPGMGPMGPMAGKGAKGGRHMQDGGRMRHEKPESFTEESTRKMADGRVFKRSIEQKVSEGSFYRKEVVTNPEGKTASTTVSATFDKAKNTWVRKVEGVDFDGGTWSRSKEGSMAPHEGDDEGAQEAKPAPQQKSSGKKSK